MAETLWQTAWVPQVKSLSIEKAGKISGNDLFGDLTEISVNGNAENEISSRINPAIDPWFLW